MKTIEFNMTKEEREEAKALTIENIKYIDIHNTLEKSVKKEELRDLLLDLLK